MKALVPLVGVWFLILSCSSTLWDQPTTDLKAAWARGDTSLLLAKSSEDLAQADFGALGPGGFWNVGLVLAAADRDDDAELVWRRGLKSEPSPWREASARQLFDLAAQRRDWPAAQVWAEKLKAWAPDDPAAQRRWFEALYFQKKDQAALAVLESWKPGTFSAEEEDENQLFAGVLAARTGDRDRASRLLGRLVFDQEASVLHFRLESFFQEDEARYDLLGPGGRDAVAFQSVVYRGSFSDWTAWQKGRKLPAGFWNHQGLLLGLEALYKAEGRAEGGLRFLATVDEGLTGPARFEADFARGRFLRSLGRWAQALPNFERAVDGAPTAADRQRALWNLLQARVQTDPEAVLPALAEALKGAEDPEYYSEVVETWISELVQGRHWATVAAALRDLGPLLAPEDRVELTFVAARLADRGLVDLGAQGVTQAPGALLASVAADRPFSYEGLTAAALLGTDLKWAAPGPSPNLNPRDRDQMALWLSQADYGFSRTLAAALGAHRGPLDPRVTLEIVDKLQARQDWRPSLQILYRLLADPGQSVTHEVALRLYPAAFLELIEDRAQAQGVNPSLLYGLVREESSFDPGAKSWVGAEGLTQLMPATAAETAQRLRLKEFNLADPGDNLTLGARYLATQIRSQGSVYLALMAYNAGGGRIRPWKASLADLPEELFVEAAPIAETRNYVKKVLTSTVLAGVLRYQGQVGSQVRLVYPNLDGAPAAP